MLPANGGAVLAEPAPLDFQKGWGCVLLPFILFVLKNATPDDTSWRAASLTSFPQRDETKGQFIETDGARLCVGRR